MIPSTWLPHFRERDGELAGYLDGAEPTVIPRTLFGYPLAPAGLTAGDVVLLHSSLSTIGWVAGGPVRSCWPSRMFSPLTGR